MYKKSVFVIAFMVVSTLNLAYSQPMKPKCNQERYDIAHGSDLEWNKLIDNACTAIDKGEYESALKFLGDALKSDSAANREPDAFITNQYEKIKYYIEDVTAMQADSLSKVMVSDSSSSQKQTAPDETVTPPVEAKTETGGGATVAVTTTTVAVAGQNNEESNTKTSEATETKKEPEQKVAEPPSSTGEVVVEPVTKQFTEAELSEFRNKGQQKLKMLEDFIAKISNKSNPASLANDAIENAITLFASENQYVQVSSINRPDKPRYKIRNYLNRLRNLDYENVEIAWAEFQYASDFKEAPDGTYRGYITFRQTFTASKDNQVVYQDVTTKKTEIILKKMEKAVEGVLEEKWDVFLGDISIEQTEK